MALPLRTRIGDRSVTFSALIDLAPLGALVRGHPFTQRGEISVVDADGRTVLEPAPRALADRAIVASATPLIGAAGRADALEAYVRPDGTAMLGAYAFPASFPWAIVTELSEASAYAVVNQMLRNLLLVGLAGFGVAAAAALFFAHRLTGPMLKIGEVANRVGAGDLAARVEGVRTRDEIGDLAARMNAMIRQLSERLELMKFVSHETLTAIRAADASGVARGAVRRRAAVLFSDIRGYTAFAEIVAPEVVVEMLNQYLDAQTAIVERHGGDVDKFIGDEVVAVFQGPDMERRAVLCGLEVQRALAELLEEHPDWNLHAGPRHRGGRGGDGRGRRARAARLHRARPGGEPRLPPLRRRAARLRCSSPAACATRSPARTSWPSSRCRRSSSRATPSRSPPSPPAPPCRRARSALPAGH